MAKDVKSEKDYSEEAIIEELGFPRDAYVRLIQALAHSFRAPLYGPLNSGSSSIVTIMSELYGSYLSKYTRPEALAVLLNKLDQLDKRTMGLTSAFKKLETDVDVLKKKEGDIETEGKWPSYAIEDFGKIVENIKGIESADDDKSFVLYHIMEIEVLLGKVEDKARVTNREYEARLAASLHDICRIHEPSELSNEQIKRFTDSVRSLIEGWGKLNREKVKWIRKRLLEVGLTWLPVTKKAEKDIAEAKKVARIDEQ